MRKLLYLLILAPLAGICQENANLASSKGIHFEKELSWQQIKEKAKQENKYIFIDCYASWCGPCKKMDMDVYPNDSVGKFVNEHFVSVKVQMDTSKSDDERTKAWYLDAHELMAIYKITVFPSFLFLSPEGKIVHRSQGYQKAYDFANLAIEATNPDKQYYTLLQLYQNGARNYTKMSYLAKDSRNFRNPELALAIAADYLHGYLDKLSNAEFCTKENLDFISIFIKTLNSQDKVFEYLFRNGELADSTMHDRSYSKSLVNYIISKEEIIPLVSIGKNEKKEPDWKRISKHIKSKYGHRYVDENVIHAKIGWYKYIKDWRNYTKYLALQMEMFNLENMSSSIIGGSQINSVAWDIFQYSENKQELEKAVSWTDIALKIGQRPPGEYFDTQANLLYKLGKKEEALSIEAKALELAPDDKEIQTAYQKMQHGEPTWTVH